MQWTMKCSIDSKNYELQLVQHVGKNHNGGTTVLIFFHWHYSPLWALACRTMSFHFFSNLPPTLFIFSHPALEDLFLLPLSILSWAFPFFSSLPVLEWRSFWASYPPPFSQSDLTSLSFALLSILLYFLLCSSLLVLLLNTNTAGWYSGSCNRTKTSRSYWIYAKEWLVSVTRKWRGSTTSLYLWFLLKSRIHHQSTRSNIPDTNFSLYPYEEPRISHKSEYFPSVSK